MERLASSGLITPPCGVPQVLRFLGYSFGPHCYRKDGHRYTGASPSPKSVQRLKARVGEILLPSNVAPWDEVRGRLNRLLRGWAAY
jgi:RNA-directed DNA polymerase